MIGALVAGITGSGGATLSSYESIATITASGSQSTVTFSSIPSTFKHLQLRINGREGTSGGVVYARLNGDTGTNYAWHYLRGSGASTIAAAGAASQSEIWLSTFLGYSADYSGAILVDILDYANTSKYKTTRTFAGTYDTVNNAISISSGLWLNTAAVNSITIFTSNNYDNRSSFALYGIKEA